MDAVLNKMLQEEKAKLQKRISAIDEFLASDDGSKRKGKRGKRGPMSEASKAKMRAAWVKRKKEAKAKEKAS